MPKNAIVVGAPRSGTSLTARIFTAQNFHCGEVERDVIREGDDFNPFGYFEADDLIERNVQIFQRAGFSHHNTWLFDPISERSAEKIFELPLLDEDRRFLEAYDQKSPWMWKDPRLCYTLSYWWRLMDPDRTGVVLIRRNPEDVYWSFRRMGWCDAGDAQRQQVIERIEQHMHDALLTVKTMQIPHVAIEYAEFKTDPQCIVERLNEAFKLKLSVCDLNFRSDLDHSSFRGRLFGYLRILLKKLPRNPVRKLESFVPRRLMTALFPERKYQSPRD